jgi:prepilin-type N-terminal cleavage/methylation domain-containing protein
VYFEIQSRKETVKMEEEFELSRKTFRFIIYGKPKRIGCGRSNASLKGFTLVELLVVIAIIALLLSILMPALQKVRKQTKQVICKSNLHQIAMAMFAYAEDSADKRTPGPTRKNHTFAYGGGWYMNAIYMYGWGTDPKTNPPIIQGWLVDGKYANMNIFHCPANMTPIGPKGGYGTWSSYHIRDDHVAETDAKTFQGLGFRFTDMRYKDAVGTELFMLDAKTSNALYGGHAPVFQTYHGSFNRNIAYSDLHVENMIYQIKDAEYSDETAKIAYEGGFYNGRKLR